MLFRLLEQAREAAIPLAARDIRILGPASSPMERRSGRYRAQLLLQSTDSVQLVPALILQGAARATLFTVLVLTLVELPGIGATRAGAASGLFFSCAEVGGVLGPVALGLLYDGTGGFAAGLRSLSVLAFGLGLGAIHLRRLDARRNASAKPAR